KLASLAPAQEERTELKIFVNAAAPLESDILVRYQVGGASWVPSYDARLITGTKAQAPSLQLVRRASIQQKTGEAWENVALSLSTARPGAGSAAPELTPLIIDYEPDNPPPPRPAPMGAPRALTQPPAAGRVAEEQELARKEAPATQAAEQQRASVDAQAFQAVYGIAGR